MIDHRAAFKEEARELLAELEGSLLELEETPDDREIIGRVFRALHTIKGSGAMFGFDEIAAFTHEVETTFDLIREGSLKVTGPLIGLTLSSCDHIRSLLESLENGQEPDRDNGQRIITTFKELTSGVQTSAGDTPFPDEHSPAAGEESGSDITYRIRFRPDGDLLATGSNPILLLNELGGLGPCKILAQTEAIPPLDRIDPEQCYTYWDIILTTQRGINAIRDVFIFVEDGCSISIDVIDDGEDAEEEEAAEPLPKNHKKLGEILVEKGDLAPQVIEEVLGAQKPIGRMLVDAGAVNPGLVESACAEQEYVKEIRRTKAAKENSATIRVPADKLDILVNLVGELVTVQARLSQIAAIQNSSEILSVAEEVERLTEALRENTMNIRMVPIGTTFSKFKRMVRDLAVELGKEVVMVTEGAETELDKTVIERLNDPLIHLIRNCIDHGIELPGIRTAAGKPPQGTVRLAASHSGANVLIEISDDGKGLDREAIQAKAVAKGLIPAEAELSEKDAYALVFHAGFSTATSVTSVSGRGVGMDVVKRNIEALRGTIDIQSRQGSGTTITLKLPLTLAIIEGLLVRVGAGQFVLPLSIVQECVELTPVDRARSNGSDLVRVRGELVPYIRLREQFMVDGTSPEIEQIIITEANEGKFGFVVDQVIGERQTVIKNLGKLFGHVEGISGATILGDGKVALILDVPKLVRKVENAADSIVMH